MPRDGETSEDNLGVSDDTGDASPPDVHADIVALNERFATWQNEMMGRLSTLENRLSEMNQLPPPDTTPSSPAAAEEPLPSDLKTSADNVTVETETIPTLPKPASRTMRLALRRRR